MNYGADRKTQLTSRFHFLFLLKNGSNAHISPPNYPKTADLDGYPWPGLCSPSTSAPEVAKEVAKEVACGGARISLSDFLGDLRAYDGLRQPAFYDK